LPENYDEANPRLEALGGFLGLDRVIASLDSIHAGVTARGAKMVMTSFSWLVEDGLRLNFWRTLPPNFRHSVENMRNMTTE
jgi:hypothetical protein